MTGVGGEHYSTWSRDKPCPYNKSVEEKKRDFRGVFARMEENYNLPRPNTVYEMDIFIPMSLFNYLLDQFIPGSNKNFSSHYKEEGQAELIKVSPHPFPMEGVSEAQSFASQRYPPELQNASYAYLGPYDSVRQYGMSKQNIAKRILGPGIYCASGKATNIRRAVHDCSEISC